MNSIFDIQDIISSILSFYVPYFYFHPRLVNKLWLQASKQSYELFKNKLKIFNPLHFKTFFTQKNY